MILQVCIYHNLFTQVSVDRHLGFFQFGPQEEPCYEQWVFKRLLESLLAVLWGLDLEVAPLIFYLRLTVTQREIDWG